MTDDSLAARAHEVEAARVAQAEAAAAIEAPQRHHATIAARLAEISQKRAAIAARRAAGSHLAGDAGELEVLALDGQHLETLLPPADEKLKVARAAHVAASKAVAAAQATYVHEEAGLRLAAVDAHADRLLQLLAETLAERGAAASVLPVADRDLDAIVRHGVALETLLLTRIRAARFVAKAASPAGRGAWRPDENLAFELQRLHLQGGHL